MPQIAPLFLRLYLPIAALVLAGILLYGRAEVERDMTRLRSQENLNVGLGAGAMSRNLETLTRDLDFLSRHGALRNALDAPTPQHIAQLTDDLINFSRAKRVYDQLRWLDETGMEIVRVDYAAGHPAAVTADKLQNKGKRYFFTDSFKLNPGEIFISPLDLNIEQDRIEIPHKPMVRVATPVRDSLGRKRGIVILNYHGREILDVFALTTANIADHIMVTNGAGYWLKSPRPDDEWGFMFDRPELTLAARAPAAWERIRATDSGQEALADGLWTWQTVYPLLAGQKSSTGAADAAAPSRGEVETRQYQWKTIAHLSGDTLASLRRATWLKLAAAAALLLGLFGFGSWKLARAWAAQADAEAEVRRINAGLEATVDTRTRELHAANAELGHRNADMESMIYIASHDLRSPLVNIQGFGQRLEKAMADIVARLARDDVPASVRADLDKTLAERMPTALDFIKSSSRKMDTLINGLLRLSRAGRAQINRQTLDMDTMLREILATLAIQIQNAGASVTVGALPPCRGDATQINQVFTNLIDNAIKYRDPARPLSLHIAGDASDGLAHYTVADNGQGIATEYQPKIWQLFHRLDPNGAVSGEGIGLTLVLRILERNRGRIWLESAAGQGSRFHIELPLPTPQERL